eukprot:4281733-Alexandrium_andersonii.AAC.1
MDACSALVLGSWPRPRRACRRAVVSLEPVPARVHPSLVSLVHSSLCNQRPGSVVASTLNPAPTSGLATHRSA